MTRGRSESGPTQQAHQTTAGRAGARRRHPRTVLPMNSDIEVATVVGVPVMIRLRPAYFGLVVLGGAAGAAARFWLVLFAPSWHTLSLGTMAVNLLGPYFLGLLLQALAQRPEGLRTRGLRLLLGVGFLGAFTSYAQLAVDAVTVSEHGMVLVAVVYVVATIITGIAAVWLGIATARHLPAAARRNGLEPAGLAAPHENRANRE